jgi:hypothetical protein
MKRDLRREREIALIEQASEPLRPARQRRRVGAHQQPVGLDAAAWLRQKERDQLDKEASKRFKQKPDLGEEFE